MHIPSESGNDGHIYVPQLMWQWTAGVRPVPIERCVPIERATDGAVTRRDLRPDDWQEIWPELATPTTAPATAGD